MRVQKALSCLVLGTALQAQEQDTSTSGYSSVTRLAALPGCGPAPPQNMNMCTLYERPDQMADSDNQTDMVPLGSGYA